MTLSTAAVTLESLVALPNRESVLLALKDLKNSVIGNTWKKVEVAGNDGLKDLYVRMARGMTDTF
jgi:phage-related protein